MAHTYFSLWLMLNILNLKRCSSYFFNLIKYSYNCSWKWSLAEMKGDFPSERDPSSTGKWKIPTEFKQKRIGRYPCRLNVKHLIFVSSGILNFRTPIVSLLELISKAHREDRRHAQGLWARPWCAPEFPDPLSNVSRGPWTLPSFPKVDGPEDKLSAALAQSLTHHLQRRGF